MNDETPTINSPEPSGQEEPTAPTEVQEPEAKPQQLTRSTSDRVIAGVAGGLGRYFGVDPVMFRIGFVISVFFGGLGVIAYGLLWLFVPTDGRGAPPPRLSPASRPTTEGCCLQGPRVSEGTRTPDRLDHNQELYQLSYAHRAVSM